MGGRNLDLFRDDESCSWDLGMIGLGTILFFLDGVLGELDGREIFPMVATGLGIGLSNASEWAVQMSAP